MHDKDAIRAYVQDWLDTFDDLAVEDLDLIDAGEDKVVAALTVSGRAKLSGVETDLNYAVVYSIRDGKIARGHDGFRKFERDFRATWESLSIDIERLEDHGEQVAVLGTFDAHGRDGISVRRPAANVVTVRDGLAVRIDAYGDWDGALEAMGHGATRG